MNRVVLLRAEVSEVVAAEASASGKDRAQSDEFPERYQWGGQVALRLGKKPPASVEHADAQSTRLWMPTHKFKASVDAVLG